MHNPENEDDFEVIANCPSCGREDNFRFYFCSCCGGEPKATCDSCFYEIAYSRDADGSVALVAL